MKLRQNKLDRTRFCRLVCSTVNKIGKTCQDFKCSRI